jgi:hypothetical protein
MSTDVSEEHIASIFRVEEINSAKNTNKQEGGTIAVKTSNPTYVYNK